MSGNKYLLDTNIILYVLGGKLPSNELPKGKFIISFINELELLSYPDLLPAEAQNFFLQTTSHSNEAILVISA